MSSWSSCGRRLAPCRHRSLTADEAAAGNYERGRRLGSDLGRTVAGWEALVLSRCPHRMHLRYGAPRQQASPVASGTKTMSGLAGEHSNLPSTRRYPGRAPERVHYAVTEKKRDERGRECGSGCAPVGRARY